ncbi:hypothetical protein CIPAW_07G021500 [Carya illinoinensis]|uniref:F-actin-capping protein subunit alpha n=2 Tax=Carya illinoinensis TaxID=32201 RepID=A0A8T1PYV5_CARIL|nr:hypothetical protein CIPAW_07G021500 [Carya illinoinensis]
MVAKIDLVVLLNQPHQSKAIALYRSYTRWELSRVTTAIHLISSVPVLVGRTSLDGADQFVIFFFLRSSNNNSLSKYPTLTVSFSKFERETEIGMADVEEAELSDKQKKEIAKWFLLNSPAGEIQYVSKDVKAILNDEELYNEAASEAFPLYNKSQMICLEMPGRIGDVLVTSFGELKENEFLDLRTAQVAIVDHIKQVCTGLRPALDDELPSPYVEEFRCSLDAEILKYVGEAYPKGVCSVYCTKGKDVEGPGSDFDLVVVISAARLSPQNFCNGSWRSVWNIEFKDVEQILELRGKLQVGAHYFEEGNVQLDAKHECKDTTVFQSPDDCAITIASIIRHHETEYLASLEASYSNLPDTTFKDLRRKLPVTRTLFPWHNTLQFNLTRDLTKELGIGK